METIKKTFEKEILCDQVNERIKIEAGVAILETILSAGIVWNGGRCPKSSHCEVGILKCSFIKELIDEENPKIEKMRQQILDRKKKK